MTSKLEEKKIPTEFRVNNGIAHSFVWGLVGLVVSCSAIRGNVNTTLTGAGLASAAGFAYGMASLTEKDVKESKDRQQRIQEQKKNRTD